MLAGMCKGGAQDAAMAVPGVALTRGFYPLHPTLPPYVVPCEEWERDTGWGNGTGGGGVKGT